MDELKPCPLQCNLEQLNGRIINLGLGISQMSETGTVQVNKAFLTATLNYMQELLRLRREFENRRPAPENKPLMRRNLYSMNDQRVWVQYPEIGMYGLVAYRADDDDEDFVYITNNLGGRSEFAEIIAEGGTVYARKLEVE